MSRLDYLQGSAALAGLVAAAGRDGVFPDDGVLRQEDLRILPGDRAELLARPSLPDLPVGPDLSADGQDPEGADPPPGNPGSHRRDPGGGPVGEGEEPAGGVGRGHGVMAILPSDQRRRDAEPSVHLQASSKKPARNTFSSTNSNGLAGEF